ncbi:MAG: hypothetical protein UX04_C0002G0331 [Microgenomates group bacterium GW2011_GWF2_45_18]|nr:MAG: hypothetical protein UW18_C0003G0231 [Microgenomates group bacterium GW2011_GWF1_44_10]KKU02188.1 MAG: hypothetical protein UX04_C0002G0331 [Microgenomates group bacterium GW2011_GWF2_45_18]HAU99318.1 hypothetical protein [Candidatus Paceibacterota bacterium]
MTETFSRSESMKRNYPTNFLLALECAHSPRKANAFQKAYFDKVEKAFPSFSNWTQKNKYLLQELIPLLQQKQKMIDQVIKYRSQVAKLDQYVLKDRELSLQVDMIMKQIIASLLADGIDISQLSW